MAWRYRCVLLFFTFLFLTIIGRLFYWQVVKAQELAAIGQAQYGRAIKLQPQRGEILTSDGFAVAANKLTYLVFANPKEVKDVKQQSEQLAYLLKMDSATISAQLSLKDKFWVPIKSNVDHNMKDKIERAKIPGVGFQEQYVRFYPEASTAAKVLGFVGKDENGEDTGYFGLEGYYDRQLRGRSGLAIQIHDAFGQPILAKMSNNTAKIDGRNLVLHIDRTIQFLLDTELKEGVEKYGAKGGMAAVIDPKTGERDPDITVDSEGKIIAKNAGEEEE